MDHWELYSPCFASGGNTDEIYSLVSQHLTQKAFIEFPAMAPEIALPQNNSIVHMVNYIDSKRKKSVHSWVTWVRHLLHFLYNNEKIRYG